MPSKIKILIIAYCIGLVIVFSIVPWNIAYKSGVRKAPAIHSVSYGLIFAPPLGATEIKYKQVLFELVGLSAVAGVGYWYLKKNAQ